MPELRTIVALTPLALAFPAAMATACTTTANPYPDVPTFCAKKAAAECQVAAVCAIDVTSCVSYRTSLCETDAAAAIAGGTRTYDSANAQACIDALNSAYGNESTKVDYDKLVGSGSITDLCERVLTGSLSEGHTCAVDYDCAGPLICSPAAAGSALLVCAKLEVKMTGDFCADPGSMCSGGAYCANEGGAPQCMAPAQSGQACNAQVTCESTLRCVSGMCAPRVGPGDACASDGDCDATAPYCDANAGNICTIGLTFAAGSYDCRAFSGSTAASPGVGASDGAAAADGPPEAAAEAGDDGGGD
jgi:hypothetical protein